MFRTLAAQRALLLAIAMSCSCALAQDAQQNEASAADIQNLVRLEGEAYRTARDNLLASGIRIPDQVEGMAGLAAFILRHRANDPSRFAAWERIHPRSTRSGINYFRAEHPDAANLAFLLEKAWKAKDAAGAAGEFVRWVRRGVLPELPWRIAKTLAESGPTPQLRRIGYLTLGASGDPDAEYAIRALLSDADLAQAYTDLILAGLSVAKVAYGPAAVLDSLDSLKRSNRFGQYAFGVLAKSDADAPRASLRAWIQDEAADSFGRLLAIETCATFPRAGDGPVIQEYVQGAASANLKDRAISALGKYPYAEAAPVLRSILQTAVGEQRVQNAAINVMTVLHQRDAGVSVVDLGADAAALEGVSAQERAAEETKEKAAKLLNQLERAIEKRSERKP